MAGVGGLLVECDGRGLLIDAGAGPLTVGPRRTRSAPSAAARSWTASPHSAAAPRTSRQSRSPTHLHVDHVGWAWHPAPGSDRPAFTGADHLVAEPEWTQRHFAEAQGLAT